jgi:hypothetical protein
MKNISAYVLAILIASSGCSSAPAPSSEGPLDAGHAQIDAAPISSSDSPDADAGVITVDAGPACNDLVAAAPSVNYSLSDQGSPPAATGGTIVDGTYYLTSYTIYGAGSVGPGFTANQATSVTLEIAGTAWTQVQVYLIESTSSTVSTNFVAAVSGTAITLTPSCPEGPPTNATYDATSSAIQLVANTGGFTLSEKFVKQ